MALDEAGMDQVIDRLMSLFTQSNEVNTYGSNPQGWIDDNLPEGTTPGDVSSCVPEVADRLGGQYQQNLANYNAQAAPAPSPGGDGGGWVGNEISYVYNTTYQQNAFIYAEEGAQVSNIQGNGNTVSQTQIDQTFEVGDDYYEPEPPPDYGQDPPVDDLPPLDDEPGGQFDPEDDLPPLDDEPGGQFDPGDGLGDDPQPEPEPEPEHEPEPEPEPAPEAAPEPEAPDVPDGGVPV